MFLGDKFYCIPHYCILSYTSSDFSNLQHSGCFPYRLLVVPNLDKGQ